MGADEGVFPLTPGPVAAAHVKALVKAGPGHVIAISPEGQTVVIEWTATTALADAGRHAPVWTHREYMGLFGHQDKYKLTPSWAAKLAGVANRQARDIAAGGDQEHAVWLRHPKPRDATERLAHAVGLLRERVRAVPDREGKIRAQVAVESPLDNRWGPSEYGLTFGDLDELHRMIEAATAREAAVKPRGICPGCGRDDVTLTKAGTMRQHSGDVFVGRWRQTCEGTGKPPKGGA